MYIANILGISKKFHKSLEQLKEKINFSDLNPESARLKFVLGTLRSVLMKVHQSVKKFSPDGNLNFTLRFPLGFLSF